MRRIARQAEHRVEGAISGEEAQFAAENGKRIGYGIENGLGVFAFVNCLVDTGAERGYIGEGEHGAGDPAVALRKRRYTQKIRLLPVTEIVPACCARGDCLGAPLFQIPQAAEARQHRRATGRYLTARSRAAPPRRG